MLVLKLFRPPKLKEGERIVQARAGESYGSGLPLPICKFGYCITSKVYINFSESMSVQRSVCFQQNEPSIMQSLPVAAIL
jgi:hypothetical protein